MRRAVPFSLILPAALAVLVLPLHGQSWSAEQQDVWSTIEAQWQASMEKDAAWVERHLVDDFMGWSTDLPVPRSKASEQKWTRFGMEGSTTLIQELTPIAITVHGSTAVAHYYYAMVTEDRDGKRENETGRYTDTLVRDGDRWRFLAWHGGALESDD